MNDGMVAFILFFVAPVTLVVAIIGYAYIWTKIDPYYRAELRTKVLNMRPRKKPKFKVWDAILIVIAILIFIFGR